MEILGFLGMDFVIIDAEHGVSDLESCEHQVRAAESVGISTMCRIALNLPQNILRYLDTGVMGAQIPQVNSAAEARATVDAVRYPPVGKRGLAGVRAAGYGIGMPLGDYVKLANEELILCVQIETTQAVEAAAEIVATEGVDLVFIGPTDLSISMGYPGQPTHPAVMEAIEHVGVRPRSPQGSGQAPSPATPTPTSTGATWATSTWRRARPPSWPKGPVSTSRVAASARRPGRKHVHSHGSPFALTLSTGLRANGALGEGRTPVEASAGKLD